MIGVYTALFGAYDKPHPPRFEDVDYILFTDQTIKAPGWQVKRVERPHSDPRYASRYFFANSCACVPEYEYSIMHGANGELYAPPGELVARLPADVDIAAFAHPTRSNVYQEARACIRMRKDSQEVIEAQMDRYRAEDFPESVRLSACILLVRRNTPRLAEFEATWWEETQSGSCRDQLSFDYVRWKMGIDVHYLGGFPVERRQAVDGRILKVHKHLPKGERR